MPRTLALGAIALAILSSSCAKPAANQAAPQKPPAPAQSGVVAQSPAPASAPKKSGLLGCRCIKTGADYDQKAVAELSPGLTVSQVIAKMGRRPEMQETQGPSGGPLLNWHYSESGFSGTLDVRSVTAVFDSDKHLTQVLKSELHYDGRPPRFDRATAEAVPMEATKAEVIAKLGAPNKLQDNAGGGELLTWIWALGDRPGAERSVTFAFQENGHRMGGPAWSPYQAN